MRLPALVALLAVVSLLRHSSWQSESIVPLSFPFFSRGSAGVSVVWCEYDLSDFRGAFQALSLPSMPFEVFAVNVAVTEALVGVGFRRYR